MTERTIIPIAIIVAFLAVSGALALLVYGSYRLTRDEVYEYVSLDDLLDANDARDDA